MREFRLLTPNEIECRIAEIDKNGRWLSLLLYKTARTDMAMLDEKYGIAGWCNDFKTVDGKLFCGIGIKTDNGEWLWKWNNGTESNQDAEKGHASDAFKRAGFMLGIGTELYTAPRIKVGNDKCSIKEWNGKYRCFDNFEVGLIEYDNNENICALVILCNGQPCFGWKSGQKPKEEKPMEIICEECGGVIKPYSSKGGIVSVERHVEASKNTFGQTLCLGCIKKRQAAVTQGIAERAADMGVMVHEV